MDLKKLNHQLAVYGYRVDAHDHHLLLRIAPSDHPCDVRAASILLDFYQAQTGSDQKNAAKVCQRFLQCRAIGPHAAVGESTQRLFQAVVAHTTKIPACDVPVDADFMHLMFDHGTLQNWQSMQAHAIRSDGSHSAQLCIDGVWTPWKDVGDAWKELHLSHHGFHRVPSYADADLDHAPLEELLALGTTEETWGHVFREHLKRRRDGFVYHSLHNNCGTFVSWSLEKMGYSDVGLEPVADAFKKTLKHHALTRSLRGFAADVLVNFNGQKRIAPELVDAMNDPEKGPMWRERVAALPVSVQPEGGVGSRLLDGIRGLRPRALQTVNGFSLRRWQHSVQRDRHMARDEAFAQAHARGGTEDAQLYADLEKARWA